MSGAGPYPRGRGILADDLAAALPPWVVARLLVGATFVAARAYTAYLPTVPKPIARHIHQGLLGWDAQRYLQIAVSGYERLPRVQVRFFPLLPLLARAFDLVLPGGRGAALLWIANISALAFGVLLHRIARFELGDAALARRAAWFAAIFPSGFVFVWGYTEALWAALAAAAVYAARRSRWWQAAGLAFLVGLIRPVGVLLAVPLAVEGLVQLRGSFRWRDLLSRGGAVAASGIGTATYLAWIWRRFGDPFLPYSIQETSRFRGRPQSPLVALHRPVADALAGVWNVGSARVLWTIALVALVVVLLRRWPLCYGAFAGVCILVAVSTSRLGSFERYTFTTFPILLAIATVSARPVAERVALSIAAGSMSLYGFLALLGPYVP
jgi:hypothetical protein